MASIDQAVILMLLSTIGFAMAQESSTEPNSVPESSTNSVRVPSLSLGVGATAAIVGSTVILVILLIAIRLIILAQAIYTTRNGKGKNASSKKVVKARKVPRRTGGERRQQEDIIYDTIPEPNYEKLINPAYSSTLLAPTRVAASMKAMDADNTYDYIDEKSSFQRENTEMRSLEMTKNESYGKHARSDIIQSHVYEFEGTTETPNLPPRKVATNERKESAVPALPMRKNAGERGATVSSMIVENTLYSTVAEDEKATPQKDVGRPTDEDEYTAMA